MKIYQVNLSCFYLEEMKRFYTDVLEMELISSTSSSFSVIGGTTKLIFYKTDKVPFYHLCFNTSSEFFEYIFEKLNMRSLLLEDETGETRMFWEGKEAYFTDPDGNVLEMLERPFNYDNEVPVGWYHVSEIGVPVNDVKGFQKSLSSYIKDEEQRDNDQFAFYGDQNGHFVLVKEGRNWYPTNRESSIHPIEVIISGEKDHTFDILNYPYTFIVRKEWEIGAPSVQFRVARPTNQLERIVEFYQQGLGLKKIGEFRNHEGYDGIMLGLPNFEYHLEFTQSAEPIDLPTPTKEHLLVFYIPNRFERDKIVKRLTDMGYGQQKSENPYWDRGGVTIEDPDGYRIVLMNTSGIY